MLLCVTPFVFMPVASTDEPVGNEQEVLMPQLIVDGKYNIEYMTQLGDYFEAHFAFRPFAISVDAFIQSSVFGTSNLSTVTVGEDGSMYYSSTLDDYLGKNTMNERQAFAVTHNLKIMQDYAEASGSDFLFTVAPNKNSLYDDDMPYYYSLKVSDERNIDILSENLKKNGINYCDLFESFENCGEELYFKTDSHWNNKGACLAYNSMLTQLGKNHDDYSTFNLTREKTHNGDLTKMLYPAFEMPEYDYKYGLEDTYTYVTDTKSVEDALIKTHNSNASGSLYMYRDSFGNALIPFMSSAYENAFYTKAFPISFSQDIEIEKPDTVIVEIVERNLNWFYERPAVLPAPQLLNLKTDKTLDINSNIEVKKCDVDRNFVEITGYIDEDLGTDTVFYIKTNEKIYEAYCICDDNSDWGFKVYVPEESLDVSDDKIEVSLLSYNEGYCLIGTDTVEIKDIY